MISDDIDLQPGMKKAVRDEGWRPSRRDGLLVAITGCLSVAGTLLALSHRLRRARLLEEMLSVPNMHIESLESESDRPSEINYTLSIVNIGTKPVDLLILTQPLQTWVAFTDQSAVKIVPTRPIVSAIEHGRARVRLKRPLEAGFPIELTFTAIKFTPGPYGYGAIAMRTVVYADGHEQRIDFSRSIPRPPELSPSF